MGWEGAHRTGTRLATHVPGGQAASAFKPLLVKLHILKCMVKGCPPELKAGEKSAARRTGQGSGQRGMLAACNNHVRGRLLPDVSFTAADPHRPRAECAAPHPQ